MRFRPGIMAVQKGIEESMLYPGSSYGGSEITEVKTGMNLGFVFVVSSSVQSIVGIAYWKTTNNPGSGTVGLWRIDGGTNTLIESKNYSGHTGTGWKRVDLNTPYATSTTHGYLVGQWSASSSGSIYYPATSAVYNAGPVTSTPHGYITGVKSDGITHANNFLQRNGLYEYGVFARPTQSFNGTSYWVDAIVKGA